MLDYKKLLEQKEDMLDDTTVKHEQKRMMAFRAQYKFWLMRQLVQKLLY